MLFDGAQSQDNIVIVPPKPDAFHTQTDEFSYSNLYCYKIGDAGAATTANNDNARNAVASSSIGDRSGPPLTSSPADPSPPLVNAAIRPRRRPARRRTAARDRGNRGGETLPWSWGATSERRWPTAGGRRTAPRASGFVERHHR